MGLLADGEKFLCEVFDANEAVTVEYSTPPHDAAHTVLVQATVGQTLSELEPGAYTTQASNNRDFIVQYAELVVDSVQVVPDVGHQITESRNGITYVYEVMDVPGDGAWRWHGSEYKAYRIHTTLVSRT